MTVDTTTQAASPETRGGTFHWKCPNSKCGFALNGEWQNNCSQCNEEYSESHGNLVLTFSTYIKTSVGFNTTGPGADQNRIQLPNLEFPKLAPEPWYESTCAMKYYNNLKNSSTYRLTPDYAEAVEFAWYRTVRILYPKYHDANRIKSDYDKFIVNEGRNLKGFKGQGIKDATKAAVDAFATCR